jgi:hypothetical protein
MSHNKSSIILVQATRLQFLYLYMLLQGIGLYFMVILQLQRNPFGCYGNGNINFAFFRQKKHQLSYFVMFL